jgi:hypothetical protein
MQRLARSYVISGVAVRRSRGLRRVDVRRVRDAQRAFAGADVVIDLAAVPISPGEWEDVYKPC